MSTAHHHILPLPRTVFLHWIILGTIVVILYHSVFYSTFQLEWDDQWQVFNPMTENGLTSENLQQIFGELYGRQYSPINQLYYTLLYQIDGYNPTLFHIGNLLFHVLNVFAVYTLSAFIFFRFKQENSTRQMAFFSSLLFAIHPIQVESVCWISASKVVLSTFFYLMALLLYLRYATSEKHKKILLTGSVCCALLSMGCKEQAVTLCLSLFLADLFIIRRNMRNFKIYLEKIWFIIPAIIFALVSQIANDGASEDTIGYTLPDRIIFFFYSLFRYLMQSLLPFKLSYLYPFPYQVGEDIPATLWIYPFVILFVGYLIYQYRRQSILMFCAGFFLLNLLPMLHIVPLPRYFIIADRYLYLPYAAFPICLVWFATAYWQTKYKYLLISSIIYLGYLGGYTLWYTPFWKDSPTLKHHFREILKQRGIESKESQSDKKEIKYDSHEQ